MANIKSAQKRVRQAIKRRERNRAHRSRMRTAIKAVRAAVASGDAERARELLPKTIGTLDSLAHKGVIHANTAARKKSRLTRQVAALGTSWSTLDPPSAGEATSDSQIRFPAPGKATSGFQIRFPAPGSAGHESVDPRLESMARTLGHGRAATFFRFTLPLAYRGLLAALILGFTRAVGEFGATVTVAGNIPGRTQMVASAIFSAQQVGDVREARFLLLVALTIGFAAILAAKQLARGRARTPSSRH